MTSSVPALWVRERSPSLPRSWAGQNEPGMAKLLRPSSARAQNLSLAFYRAGRFEEARRAGHGMNAALPQNWPRLAVLEHGVGRIDSARAWLGRYDTEYAAYWSHVLMRSYVQMTRTGADQISRVNLVASRILRREAQQKIAGANLPDDPWLHLLCGKVYSPKGEPEKAVREIEAAIAARPDDPSIVRTAARLLVQNGLSDRALAYLSTQIERNASDPVAWIARGHLLAERGEHPRADADFGRAAALVPDALLDLHRCGLVGRWALSREPRPGLPAGARSQPLSARRRGRRRRADVACRTHRRQWPGPDPAAVRRRPIFRCT